MWTMWDAPSDRDYYNQFAGDEGEYYDDAEEQDPEGTEPFQDEDPVQGETQKGTE